MNDDSTRCGARTRREDGGPCRLAPVPGGTRCRFHGGRTPQAQKAAARRLAEVDVMKAVGEVIGRPVANPLEALSLLGGQCLALKDRLAEMVADLDGVTIGEGSEQVRAEILLFERALDRCANVLAVIARLNIDERLAVISERQADVIIGAVDAILDHLGIRNPAEREAAKAVAGRHLAIAGGNGEPA